MEIDITSVGKTSGSSLLDTFENWVYIFIENTSIYEWIMITGAILFSFRTLNYYLRTGIREYLLFAGIFISMALNSIIQAFFILIGIAFSSQSINFLRQPQIGLNITWILILYHSLRTKWTNPPKKLVNSFRVLFGLKLMSPLLIVVGRQFSISNTGFSVLITISYILFDIFVLIMLLYTYLSMHLVNPTKRVKRAYALWILAWVLFSIGYLLVIVLVIQIITKSVGIFQSASGNKYNHRI